MPGNPLTHWLRPTASVSLVVGSAVLGSVLLAPGPQPVLGQPTTGTRDAVYPAAPPPLPPAPRPIPAPLTAAELERRSHVAARAGDVVVTVGEIEDHLARSTVVDRDAFRTPAGRRGVVERLLRRHLLAFEAERRGAADPVVAHRARRAEERALRDLLELEVRHDPGPIAPPSEPVVHAEQRFGVVLRDDGRADLETWAREIGADRTPYTQALARANELGVGQETPYGEAETAPESTPPIEPSVWRALFAVERTGATSPVISLGGGRFAMVYFAGRITAFTDTGPDEDARRMMAADAAWAELVSQVRADRVTSYDPSAVDGVAFRMTPDRSRESMEQLERELAAVHPSVGEAVEQAEAAQ